MNLKEETLDLLTRLLEGNMVSVKGDEMIQEFISTKLVQAPTPEVSEEPREIIEDMLKRLWQLEPEKADLMTCQILNGFAREGLIIATNPKAPQ